MTTATYAYFELANRRFHFYVQTKFVGWEELSNYCLFNREFIYYKVGLPRIKMADLYLSKRGYKFKLSKTSDLKSTIKFRSPFIYAIFKHFSNLRKLVRRLGTSSIEQS